MFSPFAQSHRNTSLSQCYKKNELEKKRAYDEHIREVEHESFSPLVFSTSGGMGPIANVVYKRIASMTAQKQDKPNSKIIHWIRYKLSYSLLRSATMCLRGVRSSIHHPIASIPTQWTWHARRAECHSTDPELAHHISLNLYLHVYMHFQLKKKKKKRQSRV